MMPPNGACTGQPSYPSAQAEAATVWPGTLWLLERDMPATGRVTDSCSGAPLDATFEVTSLPFSQGEQGASGGPFGRYHAFLPPGTHTLRFEAPGYSPRSVQVVAPASGGATVDVALDPIGAGGTVYCAALPNSTGLPAILNVVGSSSIAANQFTLSAEVLPSFQPALFTTGQNQVNRPVFDGVLCIDRPRFPLGVVTADVFGTASIAVDLSQPVHQLAIITAGSTWAFQAIYRDPGAASGRNFTPGLSLTFCP